MIEDLQAEFDKYSSEFLKFETFINPPHARPDISAFLLLDKLVPGKTDIVAGAEHDVIFLDTDCDELAQVATPEDIFKLVQCGVFLSEEYDGLCMFV